MNSITNLASNSMNTYVGLRDKKVEMEDGSIDLTEKLFYFLWTISVLRPPLLFVYLLFKIYLRVFWEI